jgi:NADH:ubiquinone reductase (non-electrogenic)
MNFIFELRRLQEVSDARKIRNQIVSNFELALEPGISEDESRRLLHTVIVGGGPTGIEFGAELYDFVEQVGLCDI